MNTSTSTANPFNILTLIQGDPLSQVREKIVQENKHSVTEWDRIPAFKGSLLEISLNFLDDSLGQTGAPSQDIVPEWAQWKEHYDTDKRNKERLNDASKNGRDAHAIVADRSEMTLSANARLDASLSQGKNVTLSEDLWEELEARGFRWVDAFAQWKLPTGNDALQESRVLNQINAYRDGVRPEMSGLLRKLENLGADAAARIKKLEDLRVPNLEQKVKRISYECEAEQQPIRDELNWYCGEVAKIQAKLPPRKGWFRVYFAHANSPLFRELCSMDIIEREFAKQTARQAGVDYSAWTRTLRKDRKEMKSDIRELFTRTWGRAIVWNNPATRTDKVSDDITRHPKIAIQLMNLPKGNRGSATLGLTGGFYQMK